LWVDQKVHGGFGIMFDDVLAGAYAALLLTIASVWFY
jgi:phosphatidylglycerophosphatase A